MQWDGSHVNCLRSDDNYRKAANIYFVCTRTLCYKFPTECCKRDWSAVSGSSVACFLTHLSWNLGAPVELPFQDFQFISLSFLCTSTDFFNHSPSISCCLGTPQFALYGVRSGSDNDVSCLTIKPVSLGFFRCPFSTGVAFTVFWCSLWSVFS